ncbi:MAG: hypothetical protein ABI165_19510 [Bryobacteraceae bacterium]
MRAAWFIAAAACVPLVYAQTQTTLSRDGASWVRVTAGAVNVAPAASLHVATRGAVVLRGQPDSSSVSYVVRQRVKARDEADARRLLRELLVRAQTHGDWTTLVLMPSGRDGVDDDVKLVVPRGLRETVLETQGGAVDAGDLDGAVRIFTAGGNIHLDRIGSSASVKTGGGEIRVGRVNGSLRCLSAGGSIHVDRTGGETWCETAGGEIVIRDAGGPLHVSTEGGNVEVQRAAGSVSANSAAGLIEIGQAGGAVYAETRGGSIQVGAAKGVQCQSAAGAIRVRSVIGAVRVSTASGSILAELLPGLHMQESFLSTGGGDITVMIPSNLRVSVLARNESPGAGGRIVSEFPQIRIRRAMAEGALNGGGPLLHVTASGGIIYLRREK